jgi:hypothetical protein
MRRRALIVGEDYGSLSEHLCKPSYALVGASGRRLASLAGLSPSEYERRTARFNVVKRPEDWEDRDLVRAGAEATVREILRVDLPVIFLGSRVAEAMGVSATPLYEWALGPQMAYARVPHPSGRNRYWNDAASVELARAFLTEALA